MTAKTREPRYAWSGECEPCQVQVDIKAHTPEALQEAAKAWMRNHQHDQAEEATT